MKRSEYTRPLVSFMIVVVLLVSGLTISGIAGGLTFRANIYIQTESPGLTQGKIDMAASGTGEAATVYAVFEHHVTPIEKHIHLKKSTNGGQSFSLATDFLAFQYTGDRQMDPAIALRQEGGNDYLAIAYLDSTYRADRTNPGAVITWVIVCQYSTNGGTSWTQSLVTSTTIGLYPNNDIADEQLEICFDPNGNIFVVWNELDSSYASRRVRIGWSSDGSTWNIQSIYPAQSGSGDLWQRWPTVAADSDYVYAAWTATPDWREVCWYSRADISPLGSSLNFETPKMLPDRGTIDTLFPKLVADDSALHAVWWDFRTDKNENVEQEPLDPTGFETSNPINKDKPAIMYAKSINNGASFGTNVIVNKTDAQGKPNGWHSPPDITIGPNGKLAVSWVDYTLNYYNVFATTSNDGATWTDPPDKVTDYTITRKKWLTRIAIDNGGDVHVAWLMRDGSGPADIQHSKSIVNKDPAPITGFMITDYDEFNGTVNWEINTEPDFASYKIYLSLIPEFPIDDLYLYKQITEQGTRQCIFTQLTPDKKYYTKMTVIDKEGKTVPTTELNFQTLPLNLAPRFEVDIQDLHVIEDGRVYSALNLTKMMNEGDIWDDNYMGQTKLRFEIEKQVEEPKVRAYINETMTEIWNEILQQNQTITYWTLDLFTTTSNWNGFEEFRVKVSDAGKDSGFNTPDDKFSFSNWFKVIVDEENDKPFWVTFRDMGTNQRQAIPRYETQFRPEQTKIGCIEDLQYQFSIFADDIDEGDSIDFECSDTRVKIEKDPANIDHISLFTFRPDNDDVPEMNMTVIAKDQHGGIRNLTLFLPVENMNDPPYYVLINGTEPQGNLVKFTVTEGDTLQFEVVGGDIDNVETLTLTTEKWSAEKVKIEATGPVTWTVTVKTNADDAGKFVTFPLYLRDKRSDQAAVEINITVLNLPDPPYWTKDPDTDIKEKIKINFIYDKKDQNEWNPPGGGEDYIRAEWGENVRFQAFAADPDRDILNYTWRISNLEDRTPRLNWTVYGEIITFRFYPTDGNISRIQQEKFKINISVSDGMFLPITYQMEIWVFSDPDNDNDGLPDSRELYFFGNLDQGPEDDPDEDGDTNMEEIGFGIALTPSEKKSVNPTVDRDELGTDPTDKDWGPGRRPTTPGEENGDGEGEGSALETWVIVLASIIAAVIIAVIAGMLIVLRISKIKEKKDEEETEQMIAEREARQKEIAGLYGTKTVIGKDIGPDQSTMSDLVLDLGGQVYHEEGSGALKSKTKKGEKTGPAWQSTGGSGGPLFVEGAPGLEFGESLELEAIPEDDTVVSKEVDIEASMGDLLEAAEEYDEEAVRNAGSGNVLIGAVPMEEQIKQMQQGRQPVGPRLPPPGQEPPSAGQQPLPPNAPPNPILPHARPIMGKKPPTQ